MYGSEKVNSYNAEIFLYKPGNQRILFYSAISPSFEYRCYGSTVIINILLFHCGDRPLTSGSDVYGRHILTP